MADTLSINIATKRYLAKSQRYFDFKNRNPYFIIDNGQLRIE
ncbi:MAG: hypothetical protein U9R41_07780 [Candidatus Marinimicrobia bacterium]|nr:hypothetical protein [Candidatus Neomarinimicrobiota bacterium]